MPPAISTTSSPTAQITLTALLFISDAMLPALKNDGDMIPRNNVSAASTRKIRPRPHGCAGNHA